MVCSSIISICEFITHWRDCSTGWLVCLHSFTTVCVCPVSLCVANGFALMGTEVHFFSGVQTVFEVLFDTKDTIEGKHWIQSDWMLFCVTVESRMLMFFSLFLRAGYSRTALFICAVVSGQLGGSGKSQWGPTAGTGCCSSSPSSCPPALGRLPCFWETPPAG